MTTAPTQKARLRFPMTVGGKPKVSFSNKVLW